MYMRNEKRKQENKKKMVMCNSPGLFAHNQIANKHKHT